MSNNSGEMRVNAQLDSYKMFYEGDWTGKIDWATKQAPKLNELVFNLNVAWLATAQAAHLPWFMNAALNQMTDQFAKEIADPRRFKAILDRCVQGIRLRENFNDRKKKDLENVIGEILQDVEKANRGNIKSPLPIDHYWQMMFNPVDKDHKDDFKLSLWATCSQAFCSLYFAYEYFQDECLFIACNVPEDERKKYNQHPSKKTLAETISLDFATKFFDDKELKAIREVRNEIAHRSSKHDHKLIDKDTKKSIHNYYVEPKSQRIQIQAENVSGLYQFLKDKVWNMCAELKTRPEFR